MTTPRSAALEVFLQSVREPPETRDEHENFHVPALRSLEGEELEEARQVLLDLLDDPSCWDLRVPKALLALGGEAVIEPLRAAVARARQAQNPAFLLVATYALAEVDDSHDPMADYRTVLTTAPSFPDVTSAAQLLVEQDPVGARGPLLDAMQAMVFPDARQELFRGWLETWGVTGVDFKGLHELGAIHRLLGSRLDRVAERGKAMAQALSAHLATDVEATVDATTTVPDDVDEVERLWSRVGTGTALEPQALQGCSGPARFQLTTRLLAALPTDAPAITDSLVALEGSALVPVLEEAQSAPWLMLTDAEATEVKRGLALARSAE